MFAHAKAFPRHKQAAFSFVGNGGRWRIAPDEGFYTPSAQVEQFLMITPLQPVTAERNFLSPIRYEAVGNSLLDYEAKTRFPIIPLINGYAESGEEIRVIAVTPSAPQCQIHLQELREELAALQAKKGFLCRGVEEVSVTYAGDVASQLEIFHKLLDYLEDNDTLYACLTYGNKPMPMAELMAVRYAHSILDNVSIGCLVYGEMDHSAKTEDGRSPARIFDITAMVQMDEIIRMMAERKVKDPRSTIEWIMKL